MNWFKLPKWSDYDDNRDITQLEQSRRQHETNSHLHENEDDALLSLRSEDTAMNKQDDRINERRN